MPYYDSTEPQPRSYLKDGVTQAIGENHADPGDGALYRTVHALAVNNTITPNASTVAHVRLGYTSFADDCVPVTGFDPGTLGFSPGFVSQIPEKKFPYIAIGTYGTDYNGYMFGERPINNITYYSWDANASMSKLLGRHTVKFGASYRQIGVKNFNPSQSAGRYFFDGQFTSADPLDPDNSDPHSLAAFLLGYPSDGFITVARPTNAFINYYAGYAQDDVRINPNLTLNLGLRYEFEQGLQEKNNEITVGFDRDRAWPVQVPGPGAEGRAHVRRSRRLSDAPERPLARRSSRRAPASPGRSTPGRWCAAATASSGRPISTRASAPPAWARAASPRGPTTWRARTAA